MHIVTTGVVGPTRACAPVRSVPEQYCIQSERIVSGITSSLLSIVRHDDRNNVYRPLTDSSMSTCTSARLASKNSSRNFSPRPLRREEQNI